MSENKMSRFAYGRNQGGRGVGASTYSNNNTKRECQEIK